MEQKKVHDNNMEEEEGFGFISLLVVVAIIAFLVSGGMVINSVRQRQNMIQAGREAEKRAEELKDKIEQQNRSVEYGP